MIIVQAQIEHLEALVPLFDGYRKFYKQESNLQKTKNFLEARITHKDSIIFIAFIDNVAVGFTQLYPLFSSVSMEKMYVLNDLYVNLNYRGKSIGQQLLQTAKSLCTRNNYKGLALQTAFNNPAQHLYERLGFIKDTDLHFFWTNNNQ